jgi:hypothetical protein
MMAQWVVRSGGGDDGTLGGRVRWSTNGVERPDPALFFLAAPPLEVCYTLTLR